jgi:hypothetical protein
MTRLTCPSCRLRFASASAATLTICPSCAGDLQAVASAEATLGFRLYEVLDPPAVLPIAVAMALPTPADRLDQT